MNRATIDLDELERRIFNEMEKVVETTIPETYLSQTGLGMGPPVGNEPLEQIVLRLKFENMWNKLYGPTVRQAASLAKEQAKRRVLAVIKRMEEEEHERNQDG